MILDKQTERPQRVLRLKYQNEQKEKRMNSIKHAVIKAFESWDSGEGMERLSPIRGICREVKDWYILFDDKDDVLASEFDQIKRAFERYTNTRVIHRDSLLMLIDEELFAVSNSDIDCPALYFEMLFNDRAKQYYPYKYIAPGDHGIQGSQYRRELYAILVKRASDTEMARELKMLAGQLVTELENK